MTSHVSKELVQEGFEPFGQQFGFDSILSVLRLEYDQVDFGFSSIINRLLSQVIFLVLWKNNGTLNEYLIKVRLH